MFIFSSNSESKTRQLEMLKEKKNNQITKKGRGEDLWRRVRCGRTGSRGSHGSCTSACKRRCQQRLCATSQGVDQVLFQRWPSISFWHCDRKISVAPPHCCCYCHLENGAAKSSSLFGFFL